MNWRVSRHLAGGSAGRSPSYRMHADGDEDAEQLDDEVLTEDGDRHESESGGPDVDDVEERTEAVMARGGVPAAHIPPPSAGDLHLALEALRWPAVRLSSGALLEGEEAWREAIAAAEPLERYVLWQVLADRIRTDESEA